MYIFTNHRTLRRIAMLTGLSLLCAPAFGAWTFTPSITLEAGTDDNVRLTSQNQEDSTTSIISGRARLSRVTETTRFDAILGARYTDFSGVDLENQDAEHLILRARKEGERFGFGFQGLAQTEALLRSAQIGTGIQDSEQGAVVDDLVDSQLGEDIDVGVIEENVRRNIFRASPYVSANLSERSQLRLTYRYSRVDYDSAGEALGLQPFDRQGVNAQWRYELSERDRFTVFAGVSRFEPETNPESDAREVGVGWLRQLSPQTQIGIDVGVNQVDTVGANEEEETGIVVRFSASSALEIGRVFGRIERSQVPNGFGNIVEADRLTIGYDTNLSQRWRFILNANALRTDSETESVFRQDRDYFEIRPELRYRLSRDWQFGLSYRYRWIDREIAEDSTESNSAFVSLSYEPLRQRVR